MAELSYAISHELREFHEADTPFAEAEDFDLLLLVTNVLADAERREQVFRAG